MLIKKADFNIGTLWLIIIFISILYGWIKKIIKKIQEQEQKQRQPLRTSSYYEPARKQEVKKIAIPEYEEEFIISLDEKLLIEKQRPEEEQREKEIEKRRWIKSQGDEKKQKQVAIKAEEIVKPKEKELTLFSNKKDILHAIVMKEILSLPKGLT